MWISQNEDTQKYSIDTDGNVYSNITNRFLKPLNRSNGYHFVNIQGKCISVHRLVALNYLDKPLEGQNQVNHIDGNKKNNCVSNLEWVTQSENGKHSFKTGLQKPLKGFTNKQSKAVLRLDNTKRFVSIYGSMKEAAVDMGLVGYQTIQTACNKGVKSRGFFWVRANKLYGAVDYNGSEWLSENEPTRSDKSWLHQDGNVWNVPKGTIEKILNYPLSWDNDVEYLENKLKKLI